MTMRALTLTQPWAGLVASGIKLVENRPRVMIKHEDFGKPFAIHASREIDDSTYNRIVELAPELEHTDYSDGMIRGVIHTDDAWYRLTRITSAVIAVATIERVLDPCALRIPPHDPDAVAMLSADQRRWFFGPIGYVLRDVHALATPITCRGRLGFWTLPPDVEIAVRAQLGS